MKAAVLSEVGGKLVVEDIPRPRPRAGEILVRVAGCGVCHTDLHVVKGEVGFPMPCVLGHEVSGTVEEAAPDVAAVSPRRSDAFHSWNLQPGNGIEFRPLPSGAIYGLGLFMAS